MTYEIDGQTYTAEQILDTPGLRERMAEQMHAERYPDGCYSPGHRCEACAKRLGDTPHPYVKVGARRGYRGRWVCNQPGCPYYRS